MNANFLLFLLLDGSVFRGTGSFKLRDVSDYSNEAMNRVTQVDFFYPGILACYLPYMDVYRLVYTEHIIT